MGNKISVIVPVYNVENYINQCIESIIDQTYDDLEIILVDDGSSDESPRICDEYSAADNRIRVIHKTNGGLSTARNVGIEYSTGDYISFVDSDDWIDPIMYDAISQEIDTTASDIVCFGIVDVFHNRMSNGICPKEAKIITGEEAFRLLLESIEVGGYAVTKVYKKSLFDHVRFPVGELFEDIAVTPELLLEAKSVSLINKCFYYYRHRKDSILNSVFDKRKLIHVKRAEHLLQLSSKYGEKYICSAKKYYANTLLTTVSAIECSPKEIRNQYREEYREYLLRLQTCRQFLNKRNRLTYFLLRLSLLRYVKKVYQRLMLQI